MDDVKVEIKGTVGIFKTTFLLNDPSAHVKVAEEEGRGDDVGDLSRCRGIRNEGSGTVVAGKSKGREEFMTFVIHGISLGIGSAEEEKTILFRWIRQIPSVVRHKRHSRRIHRQRQHDRRLFRQTGTQWSGIRRFAHVIEIYRRHHRQRVDGGDDQESRPHGENFFLGHEILLIYETSPKQFFPDLGTPLREALPSRVSVSALSRSTDWRADTRRWLKLTSCDSFLKALTVS